MLMLELNIPFNSLSHRTYALTNVRFELKDLRGDLYVDIKLGCAASRLGVCVMDEVLENNKIKCPSGLGPVIRQQTLFVYRVLNTVVQLLSMTFEWSSKKVLSNVIYSFFPLKFGNILLSCKYLYTIKC